MAYSFHFGTALGSLTDLSGSDYNVSVFADDNPIMPELGIGTYDIPQLDSQRLYTAKAQSRTISIPCVIRGTSEANLRTRLDNMLDLIMLGNVSGYLKLDTFDTRIWHGRFVGRSDEKRHGANNMLFTLSFQCEDMYSYATSLTTQTIAISSNPQTFIVPGTSGTTVAGTADPTPVWVVKNTSGSTSGALTLANTTSSETINTTAGIVNGAWIRFDYDRQIVEWTDDGGVTWYASTAMALIGTNPNIPRLVHGVSNSVTLTGLASGSVVLTYYARYI